MKFSDLQPGDLLEIIGHMGAYFPQRDYRILRKNSLLVLVEIQESEYHFLKTCTFIYENTKIKTLLREVGLELIFRKVE